MIRRLKEENAILAKEESKAKSTDMSETGQTVTLTVEGQQATEAYINQILSNPQMKAALLERLQTDRLLDPKRDPE
jgi:hypothetical protein